MFLPVKADFKLPRFPWLTAIVCALCFGIFLHQVNDWNKFENALYEFCGQSRSNITRMIFKEISDSSSDACLDVMYGIASSNDEQATIRNMINEMRPLKSFSVEDSRLYVSDRLNEELRNYHIKVPAHPDEGLAYNTESWNPLTMIASAFAHGSWSHIIFNLFFFVANHRGIDWPHCLYRFISRRVSLYWCLFLGFGHGLGLPFLHVGAFRGRHGHDGAVRVPAAQRKDSLLLLGRHFLRISRDSRLGVSTLVHRRRHLHAVREYGPRYSQCNGTRNRRYCRISFRHHFPAKSTRRYAPHAGGRRQSGASRKNCLIESAHRQSIHPLLLICQYCHDFNLFVTVSRDALYHPPYRAGLYRAKNT